MSYKSIKTHEKHKPVKKYGDTILENLRNNYFLKPDGSNLDVVIQSVQSAMQGLIKKQGNGPTYPINKGIPLINEVISSSKIPIKMNKAPSSILDNLYSMVQGSIKAGNPFMVKNLIPVPSIPALASYLAVSTYMANGVSGEDSGQILLAEIACASALSKLAEIDHNKSAGVFTFGGTGTNLYAMKIGLSKILPNHGLEGLKDNVVVIESAPAHYSHKTGANWLGIGQNNCIRISSNPDQTTKLDELEKTCRRVIEEGKLIVCINAVGGTTSNLGIDDVKKIYDIRERLVKAFNLSYKPHIHMDAVLGWVFLNFTNYDFKKNPLGFSINAINQIKKILKRLKTIKYADSFGVDFHKTGYVAYVSSMVIVKNKMDLMRLQRDVSIMTPLFQDDEAYNPGKFTLETSRSSANILATWIALQTFGQEGYQALLGHAIEMGIIFRNGIEKNYRAGLYVANQEQFGPDVFVRCYRPGSDPKTTYEKEMQQDDVLKVNTKYTSDFALWLYKNKSAEERGFAVSKSSAAIYTNTGKPMVALRIYPLSPYITEESAKRLIARLVKAKKEFDRFYDYKAK
ncbi:MAG: pyridoxal-dependent decarboxylase [Candidatus Levybacteria bacterium]|nr:pyridoxal-dependent decarboxylase [Candidatus Levybacteria bacterium]